MFSDLELTGRARSHIIQYTSPRFAAHPQAAEAFMAMRAAAQKDGIDMVPFSTFRDFNTQLRIWNYKYIGKKPLYDADGQVRERNGMTEEQIIRHILDWSALPGGSRHHWGTEIDVVDAAVMPTGYQPKLLPIEVEEGGIFYALHQWLDDNIHRFGFFRPYQKQQGGMFPEPWHLSYASLSTQAMKELSPELLADTLRETEILGKETVLSLLPEIYQNHILNIATVPTL
nr:M15 family metallopeptidase [uncultured Cardiobacterium sp.]